MRLELQAGGWGVKVPAPGQPAWSAPNSTSASRGWAVPREQVGDRPVPEFGSEATNGEMGPREAVAVPGIAAVGIGCADQAIDRKKACPPEASGIPRTYTEQVIRANPGTLRDPPPRCWSRGGDGKEGAMKSRLPRRSEEANSQRAGRREGQREGRLQRAGPDRCGRGPGAVGVARRGGRGRELVWESASLGPCRDPRRPRASSAWSPAGGGQLFSLTSGGAAPASLARAWAQRAGARRLLLCRQPASGSSVAAGQARRLLCAPLSTARALLSPKCCGGRPRAGLSCTARSFCSPAAWWGQAT